MDTQTCHLPFESCKYDNEWGLGLSQDSLFSQAGWGHHHKFPVGLTLLALCVATGQYVDISTCGEGDKPHPSFVVNLRGLDIRESPWIRVNLHERSWISVNRRESPCIFVNFRASSSLFVLSVFPVSFEEKDLKYEWRQEIGSDVFIYDDEMAQFDIVSAKRLRKNKVYHSSKFLVQSILHKAISLAT